MTFNSSFKKTVLSNGIRVLTESYPSTHSVCLGLWIEKTGVRYESLEMMGVSHLIEHMVFKRTEKRSGFEIARSLEAVGGELNAMTGREYTCFHAHCLKEDQALSADVLCDLISGASFDPGDLKTEKEVVLQEIKMTEDDLEESVFDEFFGLYFEGNSAGWPILGTAQNIAGMDRDKIYDFYQKHYQNPETIIVTAAGNVDHEALHNQVEKLLGHLKKAETQIYPKAPAPVQFVEKKQRPSEQTHLVMGWPVSSHKEQTRFDSYIVNTYLGGGMTSLFFQEIREKMGAAYNVYTMLTSYRDFGINIFYAGTEQAQVMPISSLVLNELEKLKTNGLNDEQIESFKHQVRGQILLGSNDMESRMNSLAINEWLYGEYRPVSRVIEQISKVSQESISHFLENDFHTDKMSIYILGQSTELDVSQLV